MGPSDIMFIRTIGPTTASTPPISNTTAGSRAMPQQSSLLARLVPSSVGQIVLTGMIRALKNWETTLMFSSCRGINPIQSSIASNCVPITSISHKKSNNVHHYHADYCDPNHYRHRWRCNCWSIARKHGLVLFWTQDSLWLSTWRRRNSNTAQSLFAETGTTYSITTDTRFVNIWTTMEVDSSLGHSTTTGTST